MPIHKKGAQNGRLSLLRNLDLFQSKLFRILFDKKI